MVSIACFSASVVACYHCSKNVDQRSVLNRYFLIIIESVLVLIMKILLVIHGISHPAVSTLHCIALPAIHSRLNAVRNMQLPIRCMQLGYGRLPTEIAFAWWMNYQVTSWWHGFRSDANYSLILELASLNHLHFHTACCVCLLYSIYSMISFCCSLFEIARNPITFFYRQVTY